MWFCGGICVGVLECVCVCLSMYLCLYVGISGCIRKSVGICEYITVCVCVCVCVVVWGTWDDHSAMKEPIDQRVSAVGKG